MAHTNQTPNYALSQFLGTDKPAWLVDYNGDMEKIDLGLKAAKDVADAAKEEADQGAIDIAAVTITANSADAKASGAISDLSDAYDSTSTYNIGDYVIYNSILYRCIVAIPVPESFDGTHWTRTTVEEIITQINIDLTNVSDSMLKLKNHTTGAFSSTANNLVQLGTISSVTGGEISDISELKAIGLIYAVGNADYDYSATVFASVDNNIYYMPRLTQSNCRCKIYLIY